MTVFLPTPGQALVDPRTGHFTSTYRRWANALTEAVNAAQGGTIIVPAEPVSFVVSGAGSVTADGSVAGGEFVVTLIGDKDNPPPNSFYGATTTGDKGFVPVYDALMEGQGIAIRDSGYIVIDTVETPDDLPLAGNSGEAVRVTGAEPGLYAWDGAAFTLDPAATGKVSVALAPLADAGAGTALKKIVRDAYGRVSATETANIDDLSDVDAPSPSNGQVLTWETSSGKYKPKAAPGAGTMTLLATAQITGSPSASLSFTGLDLSGDEKYIIQFSLKNATASNNDASLWYNGDNTAANYNNQRVTYNAGTASVARSTDSFMASMGASEECAGVCEIVPLVSGSPRAASNASRGAGASIVAQQFWIAWNSAANVTSVVISGSQNFAVGSKARLFKV